MRNWRATLGPSATCSQAVIRPARAASPPVLGEQQRFADQQGVDAAVGEEGDVEGIADAALGDSSGGRAIERPAVDFEGAQVRLPCEPWSAAAWISISGASLRPRAIRA
jgi:hypothetical protein